MCRDSGVPLIPPACYPKKHVRGCHPLKAHAMAHRALHPASGLGYVNEVLVIALHSRHLWLPADSSDWLDPRLPLRNITIASLGGKRQHGNEHFWAILAVVSP